MSFTFGAGTSQPAPAPANNAAGGTGFNFGAAPSGAAPAAPTAAPGGSQAPSAFNFGSQSGSATPAPPPASTSATNIPNQNAFGSAAATNNTSVSGTAAQAPSAFGFAGTAAPKPAVGAVPQNNHIEVPDFVSIFPNERTWSKIQHLLSKMSSGTEEGRLAGLELIGFLRFQQKPDTESVGHTLCKPGPLEYKGPDATIRNQLLANPVVLLPGAREAPLTSQMLQEVISLADDLRVSEREALALYAEASQAPTRYMLEERLEESILDHALADKPVVKPVVIGNNVAKAARELYFFERQRLLRTILILLQCRVEACSQQHWSSIVFQATDGLLQNNLVTNLVNLIRDWTKISNQIQQEITRTEASMAPQNSFLAQDKSMKASFTTVHLRFAQQERLIAAECLFYITYHTQLTGDEIGAIIDLIMDLTNGIEDDEGLVTLDPFRDIPSPYEERPPAVQAWTPFQSSLPPLKDKGKLQWQQELVARTWKTGKPQLLQCTGPLVMAAISAMDAKNVLMDRETHRQNQIGTGNMLLPPGGASVDALSPVYSRLTPDKSLAWKRKDIWGLLSASYALLLRSVPSVLSSPRAGSTSPAGRSFGSIDVRSSWRACLEAPTELKSFTFARLCLIPALNRPMRRPGTNCDTSEFFLSVLSEFVSNYLEVVSVSGDLPISRARWEKEEDEELRLRRTQQEQQRQFQAWSGTYADAEIPVPAAVDLMKRPDCMDDVISLAVAICCMGPEYAVAFWDKAEQQTSEDEPRMETTLLPSNALKALGRVQTEDTSLSPSFLTFLAALASAQTFDAVVDGAKIIHEMLLGVRDIDITSYQISWIAILDNLRWYARELCRQDYVSSSTSSSSSDDPLSSGTSGEASSSYYYNARGSSAENPQDYETSSAQNLSGRSETTDRSKPKELGETNTFILLSQLELISRIASKSPAARLDILSIQLPVKGSDQHDLSLVVLFSLAAAPLSPEVRGATLNAISSLFCLDGANEEIRIKIQEQALKGWELVEACQFLPVAMLDQYSQGLTQSGSIPSNGLKFPPSSIALAGERTEKCWIPMDQTYAILYEMEFVETRAGWYPSSEGFLRLLASLVSAAGCPSDLGQGWRVRSGCAPYIEYVISFILPRAMGSFPNCADLPFRLPGDQSRLVSLALQVVEVVVTSYFFQLPMPTSSIQKDEYNVEECLPSIFAAEELVGLPGLVDKLIVGGKHADTKNYNSDFRNISVNFSKKTESELNPDGSFGVLTPAPASSHTLRGSTAPTVPCPKSPGFTILVELLSSAGSDLFKAVSSTLVDRFDQRGILPIFGQEADRMATAYALFIDTPPTFSSAKAGNKDKNLQEKIVSNRQTLLKALHPGVESTSFGDAVYWRERSIVHALRILCATAVREESFCRAINSSSVPLSIVPVLRFEKKSLVPSGLKVSDVHVSRLTNLFLTNSTEKMLEAVVGYIGYTASNEERDVDIATSSLAVAVFLNRNLSPSAGVDALSGNLRDGEKGLALAFARRLLASSERCCDAPDAQIVRLILDLLLNDLRSGAVMNRSLCQVLLGLQSDHAGGNVMPGNFSSFRGPKDCFDAILELLEDTQFIIEKSTSEFAARCFEILARLCDLKGASNASSLRQILYSTERLRSIDFWKMNLLRMLSKGQSGKQSTFRSLVTQDSQDFSGCENILHSIAWLLKGTAGELRLLMGFKSTVLGLCKIDGSLSQLLAPRPRQCELLLSLLLRSPANLLQELMRGLPLEKAEIDIPSVFISREAMREAVSVLPGPPEVVKGYNIINGKKLVSKILAQDEKNAGETLQWVKKWNTAVSWDCAASHLADSVRIVLGSSLVFCESLFYHGWWDGEDGNSMQSSHLSAMQTESLTVLLVTILDRLLESRIPSSSRTMDEYLSPSVTRSVSSSILVLSEHIVGLITASTELSTNRSVDLRTACEMLAAGIARSGASDAIGQESSLGDERTVILGSAFTLMLKALPDPIDLSRQRNILSTAAVVLGEISCLTRSEREGMVQPTAAALVARSCLSSLIDCHGSEHEVVLEESFVYNLLTQVRGREPKESYVRSFHRLIASLDNSIASLLTKVAQQRFGADLVLDSGLIDALLIAADNYAAEEYRVSEAYQNSSVGQQRISIATPRFLFGHLELLSTLLSSQDLSEKHLREMPTHFMRFVARYESVINRAFSRFPADEQVLYLIAQCVSQVILLSEHRDGGIIAARSHRLVPLQQTEYETVPFRGSFIEKAVVSISLQISENPLPQKFLRSLPFSLRSKKVATDSSVASVSAEKDKSWWHNEKQEMTLGLKSWKTEMFEHGILGASILDASLSVYRAAPTVNLFDDTKFVRGFCHCVDAARLMENEARSLYTSVTSSYGDYMDTEEESVPMEKRLHFLRRMGMKLSSAIEKMLFVLLQRVRALKEQPENLQLKQSFSEFCKVILAALDHTAIDTEGFSNFDFELDDRNRRNFGMRLVTILRDELINK